jgi:hypothetical protein
MVNISRTLFWGRLSGASVEKDVVAIAVLDGVGIRRVIRVSLWTWIVLGRSVLVRMARLTMVVTRLFMKLGKPGLFSSGGMDVLQLILLGWAVPRGLERKASFRRSP